MIILSLDKEAVYEFPMVSSEVDAWASECMSDYANGGPSVCTVPLEWKQEIIEKAKGLVRYTRRGKPAKGSHWIIGQGLYFEPPSAEYVMILDEN